MKITTPLLLVPLLSAGGLFAQIASDDASNYIKGVPWHDGSNEGYGFQNWELAQNSAAGIFAGLFIEDSTIGAGDINTGGVAFGMYANPEGATATARRYFASPLLTNDQFSFQMALNFDNGNKGFNLRSGETSIFNFNVGESSAFVSSPAAATNLDFNVSVDYDYGGHDARFDVILVKKSTSVLDYQISRVSEEGIQGTLFSGSVTGIAASIDNFEFYIHDTDANSGPINNIYFNRLEVVSIPEFADSEKVSIPEPGRYGLLLGFGAVIILGTRRQRTVELLNAVLLPNF